MAIIVSPVWSSARGSIAGTTYLTTPSGAIIARQRVKPTNPSSPLQTQIRSANAAALSAWNALNDAQRAAWDVYAVTTPYHTGRQAFFAAAILTSYLDGRFGGPFTMPSTAPTKPGLVNLSNMFIGAPVAAGTGISVAVTNNEAEDVELLIEISGGFNPTRHFWKGPWDQSKTVQVTADAGAASITDIISLTKDLRYFVRVAGCSEHPEPRMATPWISSGIAATTGP